MILQSLTHTKPGRAKFIREAKTADAGVGLGTAVYRTEDVHAWLVRLARHPKVVRAKPCRRWL